METRHRSALVLPTPVSVAISGFFPDDESQKPRHDYEEDMLVLPDKGRVQCLLCGKDYINKHKARKHIETIHKAAEDPSFQSKCQYCDKVFKHIIFKRNHVYKAHPEFKKAGGSPGVFTVENQD